MTYLSKVYEAYERASDYKFNTISGLQEICISMVSSKSILRIYLNSAECIELNGEKLEYNIEMSPMKSVQCPDYYKIKNAIEEVIKMQKIHA